MARILFRQFLGQLHSWSVVGWGLAMALKQMGHEVHLFPTDGIEHVPFNLKENVIGYIELNKPRTVYGRLPDKDYDAQFSYTCMKNFGPHLSNGIKNRFGMWIYEFLQLPDGFAKHHIYCDKLLSPSNFGKEIFVKNKIPEDKISVLPHGINVNLYKQMNTIGLPTNKKFKLLTNWAQLHLRKNIDGLLNAYGKAFTNKDDVCLIIKAKDKKPINPFDVSLKQSLAVFHSKYPQAAEIKIFSDYVEDISSLYRSIDATFTLSHTEGYYFPAVEGLASGKLAIAPRYGGQLDFLNDTNSLLIEGKEVLADPKSMYWQPRINDVWFQSSIDDAVDKLRYAYNNFENINNNIEQQRENIYHKYGWDNIAKQLLELCQN